MSQFFLITNIRLVSTTPRWLSANGEVERQNRSLLKALKIANNEGRDLKIALNEFLFAYCTTPHSVTGSTPSMLLMRRELRDKVSSILVKTNTVHDQHVRDRDAASKNRSKIYTDAARRAVTNPIAVGDQVLVRRPVIANKLSPPFLSDPFTVTARTGNAVTVQSPTGAEYRRNTTFVRPYIRPETHAATTTSTVPESAQGKQTAVTPVAPRTPARTPVPINITDRPSITKSPDPSGQRRSSRVSHPPDRLSYDRVGK